MATNYDLNISGQEVQGRLDQVPVTQQDLAAEIQRAELAEQTLDGKIDDETLRAQDAEQTLDGKIDAEEERAKAAEKSNADDIDAIEEIIPSGASSANKLATEGYVNDKVATDSATFRGTFNLVSDLGLMPTAMHSQIAYLLGGEISTADNNDYAFVQIPTSVETPTEIAKVERYKFNGSAWSFEYPLNNSGFTAAQWSAINSGITSNNVTKLATLPTNAELTTLLNGKQDTLIFDNVPTQGSNNPVKSGGVYLANKTLSDAIEAILLLIPSAATALNQLADKAFVNSSIATASATFRGTFNSVTDLHLSTSASHAQIGTVLAASIATADNNDYCFVQIPTSMHRPTEIARTERYKFNGTSWEYEYTLNNSGYTTAQWHAINSGITEELVAKLSALPTNADLNEALGELTDGIAAINEKIPSGASSENKLTTQSDVAAVASNLQSQIDAITGNTLSVELSATPAKIIVGVGTDITGTATCNRVVETLIITCGGREVARGTNTDRLTFTDHVTASTASTLSYVATATLRNTTKTSTPVAVQANAVVFALASDKNSIYAGNTSVVKLTATAKAGGTAVTCDSIVIKRNGTTIGSVSNNSSLVVNDSVTPSETGTLSYTAEFVHHTNMSGSANKSVSVVAEPLHCFWGGGATYAAATMNDAGGSFGNNKILSDVHVTPNTYLFFKVPTGQTFSLWTNNVTGGVWNPQLNYAYETTTFVDGDFTVYQTDKFELDRQLQLRINPTF